MTGSEMDDYLFISGKNWKLSLAELAAYLQARGKPFVIAELSKSFFSLSIGDHMRPPLIEDLGGTIKIGKTVQRIPAKGIEHAFLKGDKEGKIALQESLTINDTSSKIFENHMKSHVFGVSVYSVDDSLGSINWKIQRFLGSYFKKKLADDGVKADFIGFSKYRSFPQLTHVEVLKKNLIETSAEILFCNGKREAYLGKTIAVHNPFDFQKRDIGRPAQRIIFSIPPRLARAMVNLSYCTADKILLDPFCGVGTILQEGLLLGAHVIGVDLNPWCVEAAKINLPWLVKEYGLRTTDYRLLRGDARNLASMIGNESVDCIATEPDLGPPLRHLPTEKHAQQIIDELKTLYFAFLRQAYQVLKNSGRLVMVTPCIRTRKGRFVSANMKEEAAKLGFTVVKPFSGGMFGVDIPVSEDLSASSSLTDIDQRHKIGREVNVFQK